MAKKKLKIYFLNIYNGVVDRGAETFVKEVAQRLAKGHDVVVIQGGESEGNENYKVKTIKYDDSWKMVNLLEEETREQKMRTFLEKKLSWHILKFSVLAVPTLLMERPHIVVPVNGRWQSLLVRVITWVYGGKMVISGQAGIGRDDIWNLWCFPNTFVTLSSFAKDWAQKIMPFTFVEYIPNGVDLQKFNPKGEKIYPIIKKPIILFVGAFERGKRPIHVINAISKMRKKANILFTGMGELRFEIEKQAEKKLGKMGTRYSIKSFRHAAMPKVYRTADIFTIPSKSYYSFEIVLLEAMASGLPVVTNDDPIRREIVGDAGLFVNPENTQEYAKALDKLLVTNWGDKPLMQAKKFSWDKIANQYEELFVRISK